MAMAGATDSDLYVDDLYFSVLSEENKDRIFPVSDATYAEELQFQEAVMVSTVSASSSSSSSSSMIADELKIDALAAFSSSPLTIQENMFPQPMEAAGVTLDGADHGESSQSFCDICFERKEKDQMFETGSCVHSYCTDCIIKHATTKIQESVFTVTCPALDCESVLDIDTLRPFLSKEVLELWDYLLCQNLIDASLKFYCPFKDCSAMLLNENEGGDIIRQSECPFCHRLFCAHCNVAWHPGVDCEEYQRLGEDERRREDLMVVELAVEKKWARCPQCKFYVERTEGCPHITCRCKYEFCYGCESSWTQSHAGCQRA